MVENIRGNYGLKVCVVDDASSDKTAEKAKEKGAWVLRIDKNSGKGAAIIKGMDWAVKNSFKGAFLMDGDGQHSPSDLKGFIESLELGFNCVIVGVRKFTVLNMPLPRIISNRTTSLVCSILSKQRIRDSQCGFRYLSSEIFRKMHLKTKRFQTETEMIIRAAKMRSEIREVSVQTLYAGEKSHINPFVDTLRFIKLIFMFLSES